MLGRPLTPEPQRQVSAHLSGAAGTEGRRCPMAEGAPRTVEQKLSPSAGEWGRLDRGSSGSRRRGAQWTDRRTGVWSGENGA